MRIVRPDDRPVFLTYCGNVHPTRSADDVASNLRRYLPLIRENMELAASESLAAGLFFGARGARELLTDDARLEDLKNALGETASWALTANAFPYGDFHADAVKRDVYRPDWTTEARRDYTLDVARLMAALPCEAPSQSVSTMPGAFAAMGNFDAEACAEKLLDCAAALRRLEDESGRWIKIAIEPEPGCVWQTTPEFVRFYTETLLKSARGRLDEATVRRYLTVCFDVCHQAVEHEEMTAALDQYESAGIDIGKMQLSAAIELANPQRRPDGIDRLRDFVEDRYLHQVFARRTDGALDFFEDLPDYLAIAEERDDALVRCHFHVPLFRDDFGTIGSTRGELELALSHALTAATVDHFEVETYTWDVLPAGEAPTDDASLARGIARELDWARGRIGR